MRRLLLALGLALLAWGAQAQSPLGPPNQLLCNKQAQFSGVSVATQLVAAATGETVVLCGWHVTNSGATGTFQFNNGTGAACGTNTAAMTPVFSVTSTAPSSDHVDYAQMQTPVSAALCVTPSVSTISGIVWYNVSP